MDAAKAGGIVIVAEREAVDNRRAHQYLSMMDAAA
jgi:hypothetical protein